MYEWLLFLHVVAAFLTVAGVVVLTALLLALRRADASGGAAVLRGLATVGNVLWNVGGITVLIFGVWLALYVDGYEILDLWIVAAIVLWLIASAAGGPLNRAYQAALAPAGADGGDGGAAGLRGRRAIVLQAVLTASILALLVVMIYKPGK